MSCKLFPAIMANCRAIGFLGTLQVNTLVVVAAVVVEKFVDKQFFHPLPIPSALLPTAVVVNKFTSNWVGAEN